MIHLKSLYIWNFTHFSLTIHLWSWALPLNAERYPGSSGWTYRLRFLCFNLLWQSRAHATYRRCDYCLDPFPERDLIIEEGDMWSCQRCWDRNEQADYERMLESRMG